MQNAIVATGKEENIMEIDRQEEVGNTDRREVAGEKEVGILAKPKETCADPEIFMRGGPTKMVIFGHRRWAVQSSKNPEITFC